MNNDKRKKAYDLLEELSKNLSNDKHREILKHVTEYVSDCPTAFSTSLPYDEATITTKILNSLQKNNSSQNDVTLFMNLHEKLKACQTEINQRNSSLTFLHYLSNTSKHTNNTIVMASNGFNSKLLLSPSSLSSSSSSSSAATTRTTTTTTTMHGKSKLNPHSVLNSALNSVRSDFFSYNGESSSSNNLIGNSTKMKGTKSLEKIFTNQKKIIPSTSENNLKISTFHKTSSTQFNSQSDSSGDSNSPRDYKINIRDGLESNSYDLIEDLVQNVIYSFTGIEGKYLKKDIISGGFKLNPKIRSLNVVQAGMLLRLSELGFYHNQVQLFTDQKSGRCALGLMGQGFISALKNELTKYYGMVVMLQEQLNKQRKRNLNERIQLAGETLTLMKVMVWAVDPLHRLQWISTIAEECQEKKGGALASTVYNFLSNGDPLVKSLAKELLIAICTPLIQMLSRWILEGEIVDPYGEFFIECLSEVGPDRLWHDKYRVRDNMLPTFISTDFANKILVIGKSINFLREVCLDKTPIKGREELRECFQNNGESIFSNTADTKLHSIIDAVYLSTSKKVLDIVTGPHKLLEHLHAMRRYLLLGQGDFIDTLMQNLKSELDKPGEQLYCYDLSSIMDSAIRSTNAQYDDPEILNHLDIRLLAPFDGDKGWDILSLQYTLRGPLLTMLDPSMHNYQILFKPLWRMKHIEFLLSSKIWKDQMCSAKPLRSLSHLLNPVMYRLHLYTSEMMHFINQMQYYILFEVIECSWASFIEKTKDAKTLDDILYAHNEFLELIKIGAFLDLKSNDLSSSLEEVYSGIIRLEIWQNKFFEKCFHELNSQKEYNEKIQQSEVDGNYGTTNEKRLERDQEYKLFEQYIKTQCYINLEKIGNDYELAVRQFLLKLNSSNDLNLQLFGIRLDFNEYYKKRDQRLGVPLTFERMRMSNIFVHNSNNNSPNSSKYQMNTSSYYNSNNINNNNN